MADITPKEKAQEIVKKFDLLVTTWDCWGNEVDGNVNLETSANNGR